MKKTPLVLACIFLLSACKEDAAKPSRVVQAPPQVVVQEKLVKVGATFLKDRIEMQDGRFMRFDGYLKSFGLLDTEQGRFDRYQINLRTDMQAAYQGFAQVLEQQGYESKKSRDDATRINVAFSKRDMPLIEMAFVAESNPTEHHKSSVTIQWKVAERSEELISRAGQALMDIPLDFTWLGSGSVFEVYRNKDSVLILSDWCTDDDLVLTFFVDTFPANPADLPEKFAKRKYWSDGFKFLERGERVGRYCRAQIKLPDIEALRVRVSQYDSEKKKLTWDTDKKVDLL